MNPRDSLRASAPRTGLLDSKPVAVGISVLAIAAIGVADYLTSERMSFTTLYLLPIGFLT